ncbi:unnamed protein product [Linum tenue]|uniref:UBA domain-containing protein n=1 Tax=Linum tenue TaxID=586396 RepID=A0AAV0MUK4_9ROSI|nr:unnamed protein product [Linum tenue]
MEYDYRNRANQPYDPQAPMYRQSSSSATQPGHPMYGQPIYPRVGQPGHGGAPPGGRHPAYHQTPAPSASSSSGLGIRVALKPEYRITPPPQLSPQMGEIPRSNFQFDFEFEKKLLAEAEKGSINWSRLGLENVPPPRAAEANSSLGSGGDPIVSKYIASRLNPEAVPVAVANYGDNPTKVREFSNAYTQLREMGFSSNNVAEALLMYDNDTEKALAHFLNSPT